MKKNYEQLMESHLPKSGEKKRLLLHVCCAPCSTAVLESLAQYFSITIFFYNPNLDSKSEFLHRAEECKRLVKEMGFSMDVIVSNYIHEEFLEIAKGLEKEPERGARCDACFNLRLEETAQYGAGWNKEHPDKAFDYFCTSLSISPLKDATVLNEIGEALGEKYGIAYLPSDFKKKSRYLRSIELSKEHDLYRQDYCGCEFSKAESIRRNKEREKAVTEIR